jgi:hypothetical protein
LSGAAILFNATALKVLLPGSTTALRKRFRPMRISRRGLGSEHVDIKAM